MGGVPRCITKSTGSATSRHPSQGVVHDLVQRARITSPTNDTVGKQHNRCSNETICTKKRVQVSFDRHTKPKKMTHEFLLINRLIAMHNAPLPTTFAILNRDLICGVQDDHIVAAVGLALLKHESATSSTEEALQWERLLHRSPSPRPIHTRLHTKIPPEHDVQMNTANACYGAPSRRTA